MVVGFGTRSDELTISVITDEQTASILYSKWDVNILPPHIIFEVLGTDAILCRHF